MSRAARYSFLAFLTIAGYPVSAQTAVTWAADASIGVAHESGGEFWRRTAGASGIAVSARKGLWRGIGVDAELGYDWLWNGPNSDLTCVVDPRVGTCMPDFPSIAGPMGLMGVSVVAGKVSVRLNAGMAAYSVDNTRLGAPLTGIDVALAPKSWFAVVAAARAFAVPSFRGDRLLIASWNLGVRFRSHEPP